MGKRKHEEPARDRRKYVGASAGIYMRQPPELMARVRTMAGRIGVSAVVRALLEEWVSLPFDGSIPIRVPGEDEERVRRLLADRAEVRRIGTEPGPAKRIDLLEAARVAAAALHDLIAREYSVEAADLDPAFVGLRQAIAEEEDRG